MAALAAFTVLETRRIEARYPPAGRRVPVEGGAIHAVDCPAEGEERGAVLLVHGASGNAADMFFALAGRLSAQGFRVLSLDRPGHGWSDRVGPGAGSSPVVQAEALRRAAERLGVTEAVVAVHSLGGITGLAMALDHPDFVRALVLIAPVSHPWPGGVAWYYRLGAHPVLGPPFRRLLALPAGMARIPLQGGNGGPRVCRRGQGLRRGLQRQSAEALRRQRPHDDACAMSLARDLTSSTGC